MEYLLLTVVLGNERLEIDPYSLSYNDDGDGMFFLRFGDDYMSDKWVVTFESVQAWGDNVYTLNREGKTCMEFEPPKEMSSAFEILAEITG